MFRKGLLIALSFFSFFCLFSCNAPCFPHWGFNEIASSCPTQNSAQILFPSNKSYQPVQLELLRTGSGIWMYLNFLSVPVPKNQNDPCKATVKCQVQEEVFFVEAERLEGGQRLLIPEDSANKITEFLLQNETINIRIGHYKALIQPCMFQTQYQKLISF